MESKKLTAATMFSALSRVGEPIPVRRNAHWLLTAGLAASLLVAGCSKKESSQTTPAAATPNAAATATPPQSQNAQTPPAPAQNAAAAPAPLPAPKVYTVPAGTRIEFRLTQTLRAKDSNVGDAFSGVLARSIRVGGVTVLQAGAPVSGTVVAAKGQGRFKGAGDLGIDINRVDGRAVRTTAYERVVKGKGKRSLGFIGGGGGGGALIGGLAGGGKGALIGGLVGAGAGTAGAAFTGNRNVSIPAESVVSVSLTEPLTVTGAASAASRR
jgi:hypothetical protein